MALNDADLQELDEGFRKVYRDDSPDSLLASWRGEGGEDNFVKALLELVRAAHADGYMAAKDDILDLVESLPVEHDDNWVELG